jgi:hypothetical protein
METIRIQNGQTERIEVLAVDAAGTPLAGLADVLLAIRRVSDGYWLDFADNTFKTSGWTTRQQTMIEISPSLDPGKYYYDFDTTGFSDDDYQIRADCVSAANFPLIGEVKAGGYVGNLDAAVSSRATVAGIWNALTADYEAVGSFGKWFSRMRRYLLGHKYFDGNQIKILVDGGEKGIPEDVDQTYNIKKTNGQPYTPAGDTVSEQEPV